MAGVETESRQRPQGPGKPYFAFQNLESPGVDMEPG